MTRMDLPHVAARLYGTPQLVAETKFETILDGLTRRIENGEPLDFAAFRDGPENENARTLDGEAMPAPDADGIATVTVEGTTVRRAGGMNALSGMTSYEALTATMEATLANPNVKAVLLEVDSHGGEAAGAFDAADVMAQAVKASGKPVFAVANETALSAGYALAVIASRIYVPRTGVIGSVGVVAAHKDRSAKDSAEGVKYSFIHAGDYKIDGNPHEPLADDARGRIQADVDQLYSLFVAHVARHRPGLNDAAVRATEARVYRGGDAVEAGLADVVGTRAQARDALRREINRGNAVVRQSGRNAQTIQPKGNLMAEGTENTPGGAALNPGAPETDETTLATAPEGADAPEGPIPSEAGAPAASGPAPTPAPAHADAVAEATARCAEISEIAAQAAGLGVEIDAVKAMQDGTAPDALRRSVMEAAASNTSASATCAAHAAPEKPKPSAGWDKAFKRQ